MKKETIDALARAWIDMPWWKKVVYWLFDFHIAMACSACVAVIEECGYSTECKTTKDENNRMAKAAKESEAAK